MSEEDEKSCWITDMNLLSDSALLAVSTTLDDMWEEIDVLRKHGAETRIFSWGVCKLMCHLDELKKQAAMEWKRRNDGLA